jgi:predicted nucleic acid-binding protein
MYAGGGPHPLKDPCLAIIARVAARELDATTSAEVVQEILHRYISIRRAEVGLTIARDVLNAFRPVLPITDSVARRIPDLAERYPSLASRDLVHVATCVEAGITTIISPDRGFDLVSEIKRLDPCEAAA